MKTSTKWLLLLPGMIACTQLYAQHRRYDRDYDRRGRDQYMYASSPYMYAPLRTSVSIVARLPFGAVAVTLGGRPYHYYNGLYYQPRPGGYVLVEPPIGIIVPALPPDCVYVIISGRSYYRYNNVYYMPLGMNGYQVVIPPQDIYSEPVKKENNSTASNDYEKFVLDGKTYYKKGNKYYKAQVTDNGEIVYQEVGEVSK